MAINRATFFFVDDAGYGWSETIHSLKSDLTATMAAATDLLPFRVKLLGYGAELQFIRVSNDLIKRDSQIYQVPPADGSNKTSTGTTHDNANLCILIRLDGNEDTVRRSLYLRGQEDDLIKSGAYVNDPVFNRNFAAWKRQLITDGWALKKKDPTVIPINVFSATQNPTTGVVTVTTTDPHGFAPAQAITISRVGGATQINGSWGVLAVPSPSTFTIQIAQLMTPYLGGGVVSKIGFTLVAIAKGIVRRAGHRIAGRPFSSPRGRRRARARK